MYTREKLILRVFHLSPIPGPITNNTMRYDYCEQLSTYVICVIMEEIPYNFKYMYRYKCTYDYSLQVIKYNQ